MTDKPESLKRLFTSESVSEGHPDKICDKIADAILDECLKTDPTSRTAVEVMACEERIIISGEVTTKAHVDYERIARDVVRGIGYTSPEIGIGADSMAVDIYVKEQSPDIALGVDARAGKRIGAGDQGIIFGYATDETENLMPLPIVVAHKLVRKATEMRKRGELSFARPDMKSQVTIDYTSDTPNCDAVVMSVQHRPDIDIETLRATLKDFVIDPVLRSFDLDTSHTDYYINPTGRFVIGGPAGDTGMTGRKIIVDTYGGAAPHGGGAFSGKDPTKVDRSATYAARHAAKNIVAAGLCSKCQIQLSYAIGVSEPVSISLETFNTERVDHDLILRCLLDESIFDFTPQGIIDRFSLTRPSFRYQDLSAYGHFGRPDLDLPFEKLDKVDALRRACHLNR